MSKGKKKNASEQNEARALILRILVGFVAGMIVMLLMMAIFSSIIVKSDLTGAVVYILGLLACCFATFLSGFVVTRPFHKKGLHHGVGGKSWFGRRPFLHHGRRHAAVRRAGRNFCGKPA